MLLNNPVHPQTAPRICCSVFYHIILYLCMCEIISVLNILILITWTCCYFWALVLSKLHSKAQGKWEEVQCWFLPHIPYCATASWTIVSSIVSFSYVPTATKISSLHWTIDIRLLIIISKNILISTSINFSCIVVVITSVASPLLASGCQIQVLHYYIFIFLLHNLCYL